MELTPEQRAALPPRFEAAGEALAAGSPFVIEACWVVGRDLAEVGVSLGECLEGLRATTLLVAGRDPTFEESHALSMAWSEATLGFLHQLSCADPATGLATLAHLRERISELYRGARACSFTLVVADAHLAEAEGVDALERTRRMALLGETARSVFDGIATIGQVGANRLVLVVPRDESLATRVSLLKRMLEDRADRVWIEGLPHTDESAAWLLDELARGA
ncbi:hypothetical protein AB3X52_17875 [Nocardioides sp. DS6]|uniref:GGDEF domain-containing protein n=1 Tax=Nocardioides eburneus TaxID=3231482 RepID=A0ABV3T5G0_9ACTN